MKARFWRYLDFMFPKVRRVSAAITFLVSLVLALLMINADDLYRFRDSVDGVNLPKVDAIVVLAGGRGRIAAAGDLWYRYWRESQEDLSSSVSIPSKPPILYVSGMGPSSTWPVFERQVHRGILPVLDHDSVILETESTNTIENALVLARFVREKNWKKILLITSSYHMKRSQFVLDRVMRQQGFNLQVETLTLYHDPFDPDEWFKSIVGIEVTLVEYLKWLFTQWFWAR